MFSQCPEISKNLISFLITQQHCVKYARKRIFFEPYFLRFFHGKYASKKFRILAYFTLRGYMMNAGQDVSLKYFHFNIHFHNILAFI